MTTGGSFPKKMCGDQTVGASGLANSRPGAVVATTESSHTLCTFTFVMSYYTKNCSLFFPRPL